jgi:hypothetical protein
MRQYFKYKLRFEILVLAIIALPFLYTALFWNNKVVQLAHSLNVYLFVTFLLYIMGLNFSILDSKKENFDELWPSIIKIRLIWAIYSSSIGFVLLYHTFNIHVFDHNRLYGVMLSLFLFAIGNFQSNIHSSSAFAINRWIVDPKESFIFKKTQKFIANLYFWTGIVFTALFMFLPVNFLFFLFVSIGVVIFYGISHRFIKNFSIKRD